MKMRGKLSILLIILLPLMIGMVGQPLSTATQYSEATRALNSAIEKGDSAAESAALASILEYSPWRGDLWRRLGRLYLDVGQAQEAVEAFNQAKALDELDDLGVIWQAEALILSGSVEEARNALEAIESDDLSILLQAAALLRQNLLLGPSSEVLVKALAVDPENEGIHYQLGVLQMTGHPDDALEHLKAVKNDPRLYGQSAFLAATIQAYKQNENQEDWALVAGQAFSQVGEWDEAVAAFELAVESEKDNAIAWALLAEARQQIGLEGINELERALDLDQRGEMVNGLAGLYHRRQGNTAQALIYLQNALNANPNALVWQIEMGGALADAGRLEEAVEAYKAAIEIDRGNAQGWVALAKFSLTRNFRVEEDGLPAARQLVLLEPSNPVYLDLLGTAYLTLADLDSAERFFLQALKYDPEEAAILIHLGQTSLYRGDMESGFAYLRRAATVTNDEKLREMAERLLAQYGAR